VRIAVACAVLVAAFAAALMVGRSGSGGGEKADAPATIKEIAPSEGSTQAPKLADTANVPDLQKTPQAPSTSSTSSTGTSQGTTSASSTGSTTSSGGGGGSGGSGGSTPTVRPPG
jgi:hypothetical protein